MISEQMQTGQSSTTYSVGNFTLLNGATFNGSSNTVKVYRPSNLMYVYIDITVPTIESNAWTDFVEFPVVTDMAYYTATLMSYPSASGTPVNRLARIIPTAAENKSTYGFYAYTADSGKRFVFSFVGIAR